MSRSELLRKLVSTFHLNVADRRGLGSPVTRHEITETILGILAEERFYPPHVRPWTPGTGVYDGTILEVLLDDRCRAHRQVAMAYGGVPESLTAKDFADSRAAVVHLVSTDFERGVDGVPFE